MFSTYLKSLNDMVNSMSETPEEQPSTGVLGRIGSWFSPWRGKSPKSPSEVAFPAGDEAVKCEGEEENGESVRVEAGDQQWEAREQNSDPGPLGLLRNFSPSKEGDAAESAHREGSPVSSGEPGGDVSKEEEFAQPRKRRTGLDRGSGDSTFDSRNPEKNANQLTHLFSFAEQGVAWDSDRDHTQRQAHAQTGKRLHVYLEETSVTQRGTNSGVGQEVVRTKVKKSLQVKPKASLSFDSLEDKKEADDAESYYSALVGVSLRSKTYESEYSGADSMGRKNAARRKYRKNSQGDPLSSPREKTPPDTQPPPDTSLTIPQSKSCHDVNEPANSTSGQDPSSTSQASPGGGKTMTSCSDKPRYLDNIQSQGAVTQACAAMEDDDTDYKVERKTETPESKRRSLKVSRSEVKLFTKYVPLSAEQPLLENNEPPESKTPLKSAENGAKESFKSEIRERTPDLKNKNDPSKAAPGRVTHKINIFERQAVGEHQKSFPNPRSAESSPVRKPPGRVKTEFVLSEESSKSVERSGTARPDPVPASGEIQMSVKERMKNFTEKSELKIPPKSARMITPKKPTPSSKSTELASQGKQDTKENVKTNVLSKTEQPDKLVKATIQVSEAKTKASLKAGAVKPDDLQLDAAHKGSGEATETGALSPKSPNRTSSKSKRRKGREATSPGGSENKQELESKQVDGKDLSAKAEEKTPDQESVAGITEVDLEALNREEGSSVGLTDASVTEDEPDTAAFIPETKMPIDGASVILPPKEEKKQEKTSPPQSAEQPGDKASTEKDAAEEPPQLTEESKIANAEGVCAESKTETKAEPGPPVLSLENDYPKDKITQSERGSEESAVVDVKTGSVSSEQASGSSETQQSESLPPEKAAVVETNEPESRLSAASPPNVPDFQTRPLESSETRAEPAERQTGSVSVEKNSADESHARGASDDAHSSSTLVTKTTAAVEEVNVRESSDTPMLKTTVESVKEAATEVKTEQEGENHEVKLVTSEGKISDDIETPAPSKEEFEAPEDAEKVTESQSPSETSNSVVELKKTEVEEPPPASGVDITIKLPPAEKLSQPQNGSTSPSSHKKHQESNQQSTMRRLPLPRALSREDSAGQESPSSWLDVDVPKQRLKVSSPRLSSGGSESNLLDAPDDLDDDDFVERIKKLCAPFQLPPRKHNTFRPPQPPFALPAIKEDRFEKTFDPEEFTFGLRKKNKFTIETPSLLARLQGPELKAGIKPARASIADRSMLLSALEADGPDKTTHQEEEEDGKEEEQIRVKSRLEGSCVLSGLTSSLLRSRRNEALILDDDTSGEVSPTEAPQLSPRTDAPPPSPTLPSGEKPGREELQPAVSDSGPPFPSFKDIKLPDFLAKHFPPESMKPKQDVEGQQTQTEKISSPVSNIKPVPDLVPPVPLFAPAAPDTAPEMKPPTRQQQTTLVSEKPKGPAPVTEPDAAVRPRLTAGDGGPSVSPVITVSNAAETRPPTHRRAPVNHVRVPRRFHKRPGKITLFEKAQFSGEKYDFHRELADATTLKFSPVISVKVVRGCWVLYEKPGFQGRCIPLEEGAIELPNEWAEPGQESTQPVSIGSMRHVVSDYSFPRIDLFTEPEGRGRVTPYHDDVIETGSYGIPLSTASIQVHSGVWMVFSDPGLQGAMAVLEEGVYPFPETWGFSSPFVGSLRPLKMGAFKVENPNDVKAVVFDSPRFEGSAQELDSEVFSFCEGDSDALMPAASVKIIGGLWVGYSEPGFEGQQFILEEGEYLDPSDWGGSEPLLALRPILSDFLTPHLKMFSDLNFGQLGVNIDLAVPVGNMEETGYGTRTQSIDVISGVWVAFEEPGFCGESYILEKGLYGCPEDWGALQPRIASAMTVVLDDFEKPAKFKVQLFSLPGFQGTVLVVEDNLASLQEGFCVASCKVLSGSWLAFEGPDFSGRMYVLEEGNYPDLRAMGCVNTGSSIISLQTTGFEFSLPSITLFERSGLRGKRVVLTEGCVNLQLTGGCTRVQSVHVEGGMWILYEGINYRGAQILLTPGEVPDWYELSTWKKIGSLRPLLQKQVHFRLRNRHTGLMMSVTGDLDEIKLLRIQEMEETCGIEQLWSYQRGHLHCKLLEECCLCPSGSVTIAGSRIGLAPGSEHQTHLWSITPDGFIRYTSSADLVLEVKGGTHFDKNQVILNKLDPNKVQQRWDVEII
ncbi:beta/gamma crystallin domain-containing protein 1-like isoform X2 [Synchiropus splendidus]|uniref:beta/gamma crystallin domain-containing protein 1-like isoform X2 n=1 Tax=Synchiropus splendidus TaxID=270530 RepID=UPI00237DC55D|nr:beta/gamma crystallin domain-containing protein 1-like isoform X2 [Synchiropus splendidus]